MLPQVSIRKHPVLRVAWAAIIGPSARMIQLVLDHFIHALHPIRVNGIFYQNCAVGFKFSDLAIGQLCCHKITIVQVAFRLLSNGVLQIINHIFLTYETILLGFGRAGSLIAYLVTYLRLQPVYGFLRADLHR